MTCPINRRVGILSLLLTTSCISTTPPEPVAPPQPQTAAEAVVPAGPPAATESPAPPLSKQPAAAPAEPVPPPATPPAAPSTGQRATKAPAPSAKAPAPPAQAAKKESIAPDVAKQKAPPLDLGSLEQRLKDTKAIGVLTKITLKNQIDDLLDQFRAFYQGKLKTTLAELRRSYDLLVMKVLSLLQDSDPPLAAAIASSREAMWGILSDPAKFATI